MLGTSALGGMLRSNSVLSNQAFSPSHPEISIPANLEALNLETLQKILGFGPAHPMWRRLSVSLAAKAVSSSPVQRRVLRNAKP